MEFVERQRLKPDARKVLVEVDYAGLYGSDTRIYEFESALERMDLPTVIDHEYAGRVVEVGDGVAEFGVDDRMVERPIRGCDECYQCRIGEENVCQDTIITGVDHNGAYERFIAAPKHVLYPVPGDVKQQHAAVVGLAGITTRAVIENSQAGAGDRVLAEGLGSVGLLTTQVAGTQGDTIVVSGVGQDADYHLLLMEELGFKTVNVTDDDTEACRERHTGGVDYDVVFDTTGRPLRLMTAVDEVCKGGQIVLVGQTSETSMPYPSPIRAEIDLQCSYTSTYEDFERSFRLIYDDDADCEALVDTRFSLFKADEAFETFIESETCKSVSDTSESAQGEQSTATQTG